MNASMGAGAAALKAEWTAFLAKNKVTGLSMPLTDRWQLKDLAAKKLFYWSNRFSSYSSAAAFARATAALETATVKGLPIYVNFNNFAGRGYLKAISCFSPRICSRTLMHRPRCVGAPHRCSLGGWQPATSVYADGWWLF